MYCFIYCYAILVHNTVAERIFYTLSCLDSSEAASSEASSRDFLVVPNVLT